MDFNFPVFATGIRIFRASNDEGPLFVGHGNTRIQGGKKQESEIREIDNNKKFSSTPPFCFLPCGFFSSIRVDPGPTNRGPTSLLALKIRTPVANTGKLRFIGQMPVFKVTANFSVWKNKYFSRFHNFFNKKI
jgi:hypothetical protein